MRADPMFLERLLQINVATLSALGALLLGMGQRSTTTPLLIAGAAAVSVLLTDVTGYFRLHRTVASLAALAAVLLALGESLRYQAEGQILVISNMLVFLQVILLLQKKDNRIYWQLVMLSLLEVVVATLFSQGVWFGLLIWVHMGVAASALTLLLMWRQWTRYHPAPTDAAAPSAAPRRAAGPRRWALAGQAPTCQSAVAGTDASGVNAELYRRLGWMGLGTVGLSILVFFTVPRIGQSAWRGASPSPRRLVGFDDHVVLGALGEIIHSREEVMRVELRHGGSGEPYRVEPGVYLRGAVLNQYHGGQWVYRRGATVPAAHGLADAEPLRAGMIVQRITAEPLSRDELFCIWPFVMFDAREAVRFDAGRERLLRPLAAHGRRFTYTLGTTALRAGAQSPLTPCDALVDTDVLLQSPDLPRLRRLAAEWDEQSGLPRRDVAGRARAMEARFHQSPDFRYSLQGQQRNLELDPIEDFVSEHRVGHCEYYATALTLMLRSRGIPARLVIGYYTAEYNALGKFFQVRQGHAHAWVEAYLEPGQLPAELIAGEDHWRWAGGGWLRLDPTPGRPAPAQASAAWTDRWRRAADWLQSLWSNYVVELDRSRQREAIYGPVRDAARRTMERLTDRHWWRELLGRLGALPGRAGIGSAGQLLAVALAALLVALVAAACLLRVTRWLKRWRDWRLGRGGAAGGPALGLAPFYRRLETTLARHGLVRQAGQTQREFAARAGARLAALFRQPSLAALPPVVAEAYYQVRFGRCPLDAGRAEAVELALERLDTLSAGRTAD